MSDNGSKSFVCSVWYTQPHHCQQKHIITLSHSHIPTIYHYLLAMGTCTRTGGETRPVDAKLELLLTSRRLYSDTLNLHGHTVLLTLHHTVIHVYIARFLMLIQDKHNPEAERKIRVERKDYKEALSFANANSDAYKSKTAMRDVSRTVCHSCLCNSTLLSLPHQYRYR